MSIGLDDGTAISLPCEQVKEALSMHGGWTWVHIGLVAQHAPVSDTARETLAGADEHIKLNIVGTEIIGVMPDLHLMFAQPADDIVRLRFALTERMLITARRTPVHRPELPVARSRPAGDSRCRSPSSTASSISSPTRSAGSRRRSPISRRRRKPPGRGTG